MRRDFISGIGTAAVTRPLTARAQQSHGTRRLRVFLYPKEQDSESITYVGALEERLRALGWVPGGNLQINYRWTGGDPGQTRQCAAELVARVAAGIVVLKASTATELIL